MAKKLKLTFYVNITYLKNKDYRILTGQGVSLTLNQLIPVYSHRKTHLLQSRCFITRYFLYKNIGLCAGNVGTLVKNTIFLLDTSVRETSVPLGVNELKLKNLAAISISFSFI